MNLAIFIPIAICLLASFGDTALLQGPENTAVVLDNTVILQCTVNTSASYRVMWTEFATSPGVGQVLSDGLTVLPTHPNSARYSIVSTNNSEFHLRITNVSLLDGGRYMCDDVLSSPPQRKAFIADLIVLDKTTECTSSVPSDGQIHEYMNYSSECTQRFSGQITPNMTWSSQLNATFFQQYSISNNILKSLMTFEANTNFNEDKFTCKLHFSDYFLPVPDGKASNVPAYQAILHTGPTLTVHVPDSAMRSYQISISALILPIVIKNLIAFNY